MASPGQLVELISETLGVPRATVALHDRNLAEAGLRKMGGRGPSAAIMDSVDAANLLTAVVAAPINGPAIVSSAETCELYSSLRRSKESQGRWRDTKIPTAATFPSNHTFREALIGLIDAAREGEFADTRARNWLLQVSILAPFPYAKIAFPAIDIEMNYGDAVPEEKEHQWRWYSARVNKFGAGDLGQTRWFTTLTIRKIGLLLGKLPAASARRASQLSAVEQRRRHAS